MGISLKIWQAFVTGAIASAAEREGRSDSETGLNRGRLCYILPAGSVQRQD